MRIIWSGAEQGGFIEFADGREVAITCGQMQDLERWFFERAERIAPDSAEVCAYYGREVA